MTEADFDAMAAGMPQATYADHFGMGAWKVAGKKIFACPSATRGGRAVLKLTPEQQEMLCAAEPSIFQIQANAWAKQGWTDFVVGAADETTAKSALWTAWRNVAPKTLLKQHP